MLRPARPRSHPCPTPRPRPATCLTGCGGHRQPKLPGDPPSAGTGAWVTSPPRTLLLARAGDRRRDRTNRSPPAGPGVSPLPPRRDGGAGTTGTVTGRRCRTGATRAAAFPEQTRFTCLGDSISRACDFPWVPGRAPHHVPGPRRRPRHRSRRAMPPRAASSERPACHSASLPGPQGKNLQGPSRVRGILPGGIGRGGPTHTGFGWRRVRRGHSPQPR